MTSTLDHRIADAFATEQSSADLAKLLDEVRAAAIVARQSRDEPNRIALDPATRPEAALEAKRAGDEATFTAARFDKAVDGLDGLLKAARVREAQAIAAQEFAAAQVERDALVRDIALIYPKAAGDIFALLSRIERSNARIGGAEALARGAPADWRTYPRPQMPSLIQGVRLPNFELSHHGVGYLWDGLAKGV